MRQNRGRTDIATDDPELRAMWEAGLGVSEIHRRIGRPSTGGGFGVIDPTPQPIGCCGQVGRAGESGEMRAYRRFPIAGHKPRWE